MELNAVHVAGLGTAGWVAPLPPARRLPARALPEHHRVTSCGRGCCGGCSTHACMHACAHGRACACVHLQDEDLIQWLGEQARDVPGLEGAVEGVRVVRDKANSVGKGFAFVLLNSQVSAHGTPLLAGTRRRSHIATLRLDAVVPGSHASIGGAESAGRVCIMRGDACTSTRCMIACSCCAHTRQYMYMEQLSCNHRPGLLFCVWGSADGRSAD